jgi:hypothetical protein
MRWDALFTDLESQLHSASMEQQESEIRDRARTEHARVSLSQRLVGQIGQQVSISTRGGRTLSGLLSNVGSEWLAVVVEGRSVVVPLRSLQILRGLDRKIGRSLTGVEARLGLGSALRGLSRDRAAVALWIGVPCAPFRGVIERVGADFLEFGLAGAGDDRRPVVGRDVLTVPFASIDAVDAARPGA